MSLTGSRRRIFGPHVRDACGQNAELRHRVNRLLNAFEHADTFLSKRAADSFEVESSARFASEVGQTIDRYKLLEKIGEGGFGDVYMAEQVEPVVRKVALKVIKPGMDSRQVIARFEAERQALALMDHKNIGKFLDAGTTSANGGPALLCHGIGPRHPDYRILRLAATFDRPTLTNFLGCVRRGWARPIRIERIRRVCVSAARRSRLDHHEGTRTTFLNLIRGESSAAVADLSRQKRGSNGFSG